MPTAKKAEAAAKLSFEQAMTRLSEIADILQNKSPALEEALALYEEGVKLLKENTKLLNEAKEKITILNKNQE